MNEKNEEKLPELCLKVILKVAHIWSGKSESCHKQRVLVSFGPSVTSQKYWLLFCELSKYLFVPVSSNWEWEKE